jgi:hypothetical protein
MMTLASGITLDDGSSAGTACLLAHVKINGLDKILKFTLTLSNTIADTKPEVSQSRGGIQAGGTAIAGTPQFISNVSVTVLA